MKDFEFYNNIRLSNSKNIKSFFNKLRNVYKDIPDTKGCLNNINKKDGCNGWCCKIQNPQLLYSEFILVWDTISREWSNEDVLCLIEKSMMNAVDKIPSKGCVFFDSESKMCKIHNVRPFNCRIYGITPLEEFNTRYEKLKKEYDSIIGAVAKPQCELVSTVDGIDVPVGTTDKWWKRLFKIERSIGIPSNLISDEIGGSYRTFHDHILLYNMPENVLNSLSGIRLYKDPLDKVKGVRLLIDSMRSHFEEE